MLLSFSFVCLVFTLTLLQWVESQHVTFLAVPQQVSS